MQRQPRHSADFKAQVALEALQGRETPEQLATRHGLPVALVYRWRDDLQQRSPSVFLSRRTRLAGFLWPRSIGMRSGYASSGPGCADRIWRVLI
jgi:transposase-like protein